MGDGSVPTRKTSFFICRKRPTSAHAGFTSHSPLLPRREIRPSFFYPFERTERKPKFQVRIGVRIRSLVIKPSGVAIGRVGPIDNDPSIQSRSSIRKPACVRRIIDARFGNRGHGIKRSVAHKAQSSALELEHRACPCGKYVQHRADRDPNHDRHRTARSHDTRYPFANRRIHASAKSYRAEYRPFCIQAIWRQRSLTSAEAPKRKRSGERYAPSSIVPSVSFSMTR